ncbi:MAG TPA: site-specific integrase, partial [Polyangium sp.]|nr:site-specific integrase [Polyangium sp.]
MSEQTKRRGRGRGTVEPMPNGTFRPRLPGAGARLRPCTTYEEAERLLDAALGELAEGNAVEPGGLSLRAWGVRYLDERELGGNRDVKTDRSRWRRHIDTAFFADWHVASIRAQDVREWCRELLKKKAAPGQGHKKTKDRKISRDTAQYSLNLLRCAFEAAVEGGHLAENPARGVRLPQKKKARTHDPWTYLTPEEQTALITCEAIPLEGRCLIAFALGTGMRESEQWAQHLTDIDLARNMITVRYGSHGKPRKNGKIYHIPILPLARWALDQWLPIVAARPNPHRLLFPLPSGARRQAKKAPAEWPEWLAAANLRPERRHDGRPVRWHDLRHTCASSLVAGWWGYPWTLEQVAAQL